MPEIRIVESKKVWEDFLEERKPHTFLQSWNWGEFNESSGHKIFRLGIREKDKLAGVALVVKIVAKRGSFLFCPHGPVLANLNLIALKTLTEYLKKLAQEERARFIRISPLMLNTSENKASFKNLLFRDAPIHMQAELVWLLDLSPSEEELLANMRKTTRYSIRKAQNEGVEIKTSSDSLDVQKFYSLYRETVSRHRFVPFSPDYIQREFASFVKESKALWFFGKYNGEIVSAAMIIFTNGGAFYHHGASIQRYSNIPVSYLVQWAVIKEAKRRSAPPSLARLNPV